MEPEQPVKTRSQLMIVRDATASGVGKQGMQDRLADPCKAHGMEMAIWFAQNGPELVAVAREAARHPGETVVAGGGDGTINPVASALLGTDKVLGRLPRGTLNHFAKDLPIPWPLDRRYEPSWMGRSFRSMAVP
jgi:diacylglycerol kinase family enzyme